MVEIDLLDKYPKTQRSSQLLQERAKVGEEERRIARQFGWEYFDGPRKYGLGGYKYDPKWWKPVVQRFIEYYALDNNSKILDVGCAKGFMLNDFLEALPGMKVVGLDISDYTLQNAMPSVKPYLVKGTAEQLPFADKSFDLVISIATIHNLDFEGVKKSLREIERVSSAHKFIKVNGYYNKEEKIKIDQWNLVAKTYMHCDTWIKLFQEVGYTGDYCWFVP